MQEDIFAAIVSRLTAVEPETRNANRAAVSIILSEKEVPKILLIKRAERMGDPWSGQVAFPGGKSQDTDVSARQTAVRETREEVGIDLEANSEFLGYLGHFPTHTGAISVIPSVFLLRGKVGVNRSEEVSTYRWLDLGRMLSPASTVRYTVTNEGKLVKVPAIRGGDFVIWGLTYRIIRSLSSDRT
jgi:8-oxo-dGTP pyrophosphatase MutT (NUDIX family)